MIARVTKWMMLLPCSFSLLSACGDRATSPTTVDLLPVAGDTSPGGGSGAIDACMTTSPTPAVISVGDEITLNASCSTAASELVRFEWDLGDGRARSGMVIHPRYHTDGAYRVKLTVTDASGRSGATETEIRVELPVDACMTWSRAPADDPELYPCGFRFDATCSTGNITEYQWFFQGNPNWSDFEDATMTTSEPHAGYTWREDIECLAFRPFERIVRLTVVAEDGRTSTTEELVQFTRPLREP